MKKNIFIGLLIACGITAVYLLVRQGSAPVVVTPSDNNPPSTVVETQKSYIDAVHGFSVKYPDTFSVKEQFEGSYLLPGYWNVYAMDEKKGVPLVAFRMPDSNEVLMAEVRIGMSKDKTEIANCTKTSFTTTKEKIGETEFTVFSNSEGAMSHFSNVKSYRAIQGGVCYAIDELVYGTNPEVYEPVRTVPFDQTIAKEKMNKIVHSFSFTTIK